MKAAPALDTPGQPRPLDAEALLTQYLPEVHAYISRRLPAEQDAEDATAETFQAAFVSLRKRRDIDPKLWLLGIARRKVVDSYRRHRRRKEIPLTDTLAMGDSILDDIERADRIAAIRKIVLALPEDQREALLLQHLEGLSIVDIAYVMRRSTAAVNSLLQRARARAYQEGKSIFQEENS